ncbi:hypothetical protein ABT404_49435 [Streptomyces hyaluromycini]|uniref:Uncharacterized protein n=1 Tax=Streptomyces hyaluromycini TaxID=1377993 RepID=A0ABV1XEL6_9ACTN
MGRSAGDQVCNSMAIPGGSCCVPLDGAVRGDGRQGRVPAGGLPGARTWHPADPRVHRELGKDDLVEQVKGIITVGEFYEHAAGGQIIHT